MTLETATTSPILAGAPTPRAIPEDEAIVVPAKALTLGLIALLKVVLAQLAEFNQRIAELFEALPDAALFRALPGAGPHLAPRLLAALGEDRNRFRSAQAFLSLHSAGCFWFLGVYVISGC